MIKNKKLISFLNEHPKKIFVLLLFLFVASLALAPKGKFNRSFDVKSYLSKEEYREYRNSSDKTGREVLAVLLEFPGKISSGTIEKTVERLKSISSITGVWSDMVFKKNPEKSIFRINERETFLFMETSFGNSLSIDESRIFVEKTERVLRSCLKDSGIKFSLIGTSPARIALHESVAGDIFKVALPSILLILFIPFYFYRSFQFLAAGFLTALITIAVTFAAYANFGEHFTYISLSLAPLIACLSILDTMYLVDRFNMRLKERDPLSAMKISVIDVFIPCTLTSLTNLVAFVVLASVSESPVLKEYGIFASLGIGISYLLLFIVTPLVFILFPRSRAVNYRSMENLGRTIGRSARWSFNHGITVILPFLVLLVLSITSLNKTDFQSMSFKLFSPDHPYQKSYDKFEKHLGSPFPVVFEVYSTTPGKSSDFRYFMFSHHLSRWLKTLPFFRQVLSPADFVSGDEIGRRLISEKEKINIFRLLERNLKKREIKMIRERGEGWIEIKNERVRSVRVMAWPVELTVRGKKRLKLYLDNFNRTMMGEFRFKTGGFFQIQNRIDSRIFGETTESFILSFLIVSFFCVMVLRNFKMALILFIVNLVPIAGLFALSVLLKLPWSPATLGLPCILFGIIVDDTIHILYTYKELGSLEESYRKKGRAVIITSVLLFLVFIMQIFSEYRWNRQFGLLAAAGIALALAADLWLIPALVRFLKPEINESPVDDPDNFFPRL